MNNDRNPIVIPKPAIEIKNISKTFGKTRALDSVSLSIRENELFGLLGPNGAGKTTLLRILSTLIPADPSNQADLGPRQGQILGFDLFKERDRIREILGYVPQRDALYGDLSAMDNLIFFSQPYPMDKRDRRERLESLLNRVGLYHRKNDLVKDFSGGLLKRLSIICALVHRPKVLFLDEVTVGLDTPLRREIWNLIKEWKREGTILVTTHYIPDAQNNCDRVALIYEGRILDCGRPQEIIARFPPATNLEEVALICQNG
ncbi:MAG: ABC transporter ATP-binding protein [Deltaproteobacteria bacterium]|nr:ABC transporter ATP-binding protein [Deltaproteobacteria bacterium]